MDQSAKLLALQLLWEYPNEGLYFTVKKTQNKSMSNANMGTAMSMELEAENSMSKFETRTPSAKPLPLTIQELGYSLETAIDLTESTISEVWRECVSCREDQVLSDMIKTQCSHFYCKTCLIRMFTDSLRDESIFPPRCCQKPIAPSEKLIGATLAQKHKEKAVELRDPDRTYCFDPKCSRYLPHNSTRNKHCKCKVCGKHTCRKCKKRAHDGPCVYECDALLEKLAKRKGWQRCSKCSRLIELRTGCYHMM